MSDVISETVATSWDSTATSSSQMIHPLLSQPRETISTPSGLDVPSPVTSDRGDEMPANFNTAIELSTDIPSISDTTREAESTFEVVKQLSNLSDNVTQLIQAASENGPKISASSSSVFRETSTTGVVGTVNESLSTKEIDTNAPLLTMQDMNIESEDTLVQVQKLLEQAVNTSVTSENTSQEDATAVSSSQLFSVAPNSASTTSTAVNTSLNSSYQSNIEAVVEMLLETAKSLSGLINSGEGGKPPIISTINATTAESNFGVGSSANQETALNNEIETPSSIQHNTVETFEESSSLPPSHMDCHPGPSGIQQSSTNSSNPAEQGREGQGLHANKEIQRLLDALISSAESQDQDKESSTKKGSEIHKCPECDKYFPRLSSLKRHILLHMDARPFQCDQCEANYKSASQLNRHKRIHTGEKPAKCEFCGKDFRTYNELYVHRRMHTGEKPFECQYCGKCFSTRGYRNTHQRIHTGEKRFECEFCGMRFTESSARRVHRFTHTGETPYKCKECGRGFTQAGNLNKHMRTVHSTDKPFKCQECDKAFSIQQELNRHFQRVHATEKPHKCKFCNKSYTILSDLNHHMQSHTFRCTKCGEKFKDSKELERHIIEVCVLPDSRPGDEDGSTEDTCITPTKTTRGSSTSKKRVPKRQRKTRVSELSVKRRKTSRSLTVEGPAEDT